MNERLKFIARLLDGEKMAGLCREFGISRKTGYKIIRRYNDCGLEALTDRSRRPYRHANQLPIPDREADRAFEAREAELGRAEDPGTAATASSRCSTPAISTVMRCSTATAWSQRAQRVAVTARKEQPFASQPAQRSVVRRLQRRVHARR